MRTANYIDILNRTADLAGLDRDNVDSATFAILRDSHSDLLKNAAEMQRWPELILTQKRYFRAAYVGTTNYSAPTSTSASEVFYPATNKYYQALRAPLLTVSSITRSGTTATATTASAHGLATGDRVTISGATPAGYNLTATITVTTTTAFTYTLASDPGSSASGTLRASVNPADADGDTIESYWAVCATSYSADEWAASTAYVIGDWVFDALTELYKQCTIAHSSDVAIDDTKFGILTVFDRYVAYAQSGKTAIGEVFHVWDDNPEDGYAAAEVNWELSADGVQVLNEYPYVWIEFRIRMPALTGSAFDSTATYTVGTQIYYSSASTRGNFYTRANSTSSAGDDPDDDAADWTIVEIPLLFDRYLKHAGAAEWLAGDGQLEKAAAQYALANAALEQQALLLTGQQGQNQRTVVLTR